MTRVRSERVCILCKSMDGIGAVFGTRGPRRTQTARWHSNE
jgi:hypothetical protein